MIEDIIQQEKPEEDLIEINSSDFGKISVAEISEPTPEIKTETEVGEEENLWSPLEDTKILELVQRADRYLLKMLPIESYRCTGKTQYVGYTMKDYTRRTVANIRLSKARAVLRLGILINGKTKFVSYKITADGLYQGEEKITLPNVVKLIKTFAKGKGW